MLCPFGGRLSCHALVLPPRTREDGAGRRISRDLLIDLLISEDILSPRSVGDQFTYLLGL
jgi:hypothetical protein